jgi:hypothetical protein
VIQGTNHAANCGDLIGPGGVTAVIGWAFAGPDFDTPGQKVVECRVNMAQDILCFSISTGRRISLHGSHLSI